MQAIFHKYAFFPTNLETTLEEERLQFFLPVKRSEDVVDHADLVEEPQRRLLLFGDWVFRPCVLQDQIRTLGFDEVGL